MAQVAPVGLKFFAEYLVGSSPAKEMAQLRMPATDAEHKGRKGGTRVTKLVLWGRRLAGLSWPCRLSMRRQDTVVDSWRAEEQF